MELIASGPQEEKQQRDRVPPLDGKGAKPASLGPAWGKA